ncbi:MAG: NAD-dependent deacylase [Leptospiraceae bacterium]|nr:NAD-dependent deacylase [Leptospiraceae bacterium]MCP5495032.1 NAD-dependent deacylase [Leptospiraceae bacterium]
MLELNFNDKKTVQKIAEILKESENILFITGAGISAESGLPTYRGIGGLYTTGTTEEGIPIEEALSGQMLKKHPNVTWKYLSQVERACYGKKFNTAHLIMANLEKAKNRVWVLTQNVDGFHTQAGSKNVIEIHGNFHYLFCTKCDFQENRESYTDLEFPPQCPKCNSFIRPDVVLFGEMLPFKKLEVLEKELTKGFDIVLSIGTTSVFPYISQPIVAASRLGVPTVEINPDETYISNIVTYKISSPAGVALQEIWNQLGK